MSNEVEKFHSPILTLTGERPDWKTFFEKRLGFELSKDNVTSLVSRLNINVRNGCTVWCNTIPNYPDIKPVTEEQIHAMEICLYGVAKLDKPFYLSHQQIEYMLGKPTLFDRQQGASTAFALLLLMQKGQPLLIEKDKRVSMNNDPEAYLPVYYSDREDVHGTKTFAFELLNLADYIIRHKGADLIRDVLVFTAGNPPKSMKSGEFVL